MDSLPIELLEMIIPTNHFDINSILEMRLVNKKFRFVIDQMGIKELTIIDNFNMFKNLWFYTCIPYDYNFNLIYYRLSIDEIPNLRSYLFGTIFSRVRMLNLSFNLDENINHVEVINNFQHLIQLEIYSLPINRRQILKLPKLEILSIDVLLPISDRPNSDDKLILDCSKLFAINCDRNFNLIEFIYPQSITYLKYKRIRHVNLSIFVNLNTIYSNSFVPNHDPLDLMTNQLFDLTKLRYLNFYFTGVAFLENSIIRTFLNNLLFRKRILQRKELQISYQGFILENDEHNNRAFFTINPVATFQLSPNSLIDKIPFIDQIKTYVNLNVNLFCNKFTNVQHIMIDRAIEQNDFINFLTCFHKLTNLSLQNVELNQRFYDQLPFISPLLIFIVVIEPQVYINFEFVLNFKYITILQTNQILNIRFIKRVIDECKFILAIKLYIEYSKWIKLWVFNRTRFVLKLWPSVLGDLNNDNSVLENNLTYRDLIDLFPYFKSNKFHRMLTRSRKRRLDEIEIQEIERQEELNRNNLELDEMERKDQLRRIQANGNISTRTRSKRKKTGLDS